MQKIRQKLGRRGLRLLALLLVTGLILGLLSLTAFAQNSYIITDGDLVKVHKSYSSDPTEVLDEVGIELSEDDTYVTSVEGGVSRITVRRMQMVTVLYHGKQTVTGTYGETVGELLARMDIQVAPNDVLTCPLDTPTHDGLFVGIVRRDVETVTEQKTIPFETRTYEDPELAPGETLVITPGVDGVVEYQIQIVRENGIEVSRQVVGETVVQEAVTQVVVCGVDRQITEQPDDPDFLFPDGNSGDVIGDGVITTASGKVYHYTSTLTVSATAYSCEGTVGHTYSGTVARVGAIAVDPKVIPLGTKMYIVSNDGQYVYGYCVAEDIGGGIKGNKVDLYFDTFDECWEFGVRTCTVYILSEQ
ncbi:MAG: G5 domain-containing protein [Oscillospiraceae bacterium]|nr:G5 domain-containing protein [Oscillospiraceae bacterium]